MSRRPGLVTRTPKAGFPKLCPRYLWGLWQCLSVFLGSLDGGQGGRGWGGGYGTTPFHQGGFNSMHQSCLFLCKFSFYKRKPLLKKEKNDFGNYCSLPNFPLINVLGKGIYNQYHVRCTWNRGWQASQFTSHLCQHSSSNLQHSYSSSLLFCPSLISETFLLFVSSGLFQHLPNTSSPTFSDFLL